MPARIPIDRAQIAAFCERHRIQELALFGSVVRDDFRPDSDVDVLVEFEPGHVPGLAFFRMEAELSGLLGRKVDLNGEHPRLPVLPGSGPRRSRSRLCRGMTYASACGRCVITLEKPSASRAA